MNRTMATILSVFAVTLCLAMNSPASAQGYGRDHSSRDAERDPSWYYQQQPVEYRPDTRAIIFQKAQARAAQRNARLESMGWYGMSNSRPTAAPTPFMTLYSPVWQQPGGRPFAWYTANWPTYAYITR